MNPNLIIVVLMVVLFAAGAGGVAYAFVGSGDDGRKRVAALAEKKSGAGGRGGDKDLQRRTKVTALLKDLEKQQAENKVRMTMRRRLEQAGLNMEPRTFWIICMTSALVVCAVCLLTG